MTASFEYWPFGEVKSSTGCAANNQKFTGKLFDNESGLQYFGARYLSNDLTRFTSVDPSEESFELDDPQSWNRYAYSLNDPINKIDPDGLSTKKLGWLVKRAKDSMQNYLLKRLSKDEMKRLSRKEKKDILGSKKQMRTFAKEKGKETVHDKKDMCTKLVETEDYHIIIHVNGKEDIISINLSAVPRWVILID